VSVSRLTKSYGARTAVRDVSFELSPGVTGLLGPNGAGKSTLVRCLVGLAGWDDGDVRIAGTDPSRHPSDARRKVGFMPERVSYPPEMRVEAYLRFVAEVKSIPRRERGDAVEGALARAGLTHVRSRIVANLSKGYRQRVGLAQALLGDPPIAILDEPSAGLDPLNVIEIRDVLRRYARDRVVLVSTHVLPETRALCDRVLVMSQGSLVYDGSTTGMTVARKHFRARVRLRGTALGGGAPVVDEPGTALVDCTTTGDEHELLVDTKGELPLGGLVGRLAASGWLVVGVEPVADALEDAFRAAVLGARSDEELEGPE
jgi:ABC-2 type transport system ATP-binding protein